MSQSVTPEICIPTALLQSFNANTTLGALYIGGHDLQSLYVPTVELDRFEMCRGFASDVVRGIIFHPIHITAYLFKQPRGYHDASSLHLLREMQR